MASALGMLTFSLISTLKQHVLYYRNKHGNAIERTVFSAKSRHDYPPPPTTGTRDAQMERRRLWNARSASGTPQALACSLAPYPYSKMCELCELCELFVKTHLFNSLYFALFLVRNFPENIDTFLRKLTNGICSQSAQSSQIIQ